MTPLQSALNIIALLEELEPSVQKGVMALINLWHTNSDVKTTLAGEVQALTDIAAKARVEQGLPPTQ